MIKIEKGKFIITHHSTSMMTEIIYQDLENDINAQIWLDTYDLEDLLDLLNSIK